MCRMQSRRSLGRDGLVSIGRARHTQNSKLTEVNDKLDDLQAGDPLLPPNPDAAGTLEVVPVHDHVHHQVQRDDDP